MLITILAVLLAVLLIVGAVLTVRNALNGCPFAIAWLAFDGLGNVFKLVGACVVVVAQAFSGESNG